MKSLLTSGFGTNGDDTLQIAGRKLKVISSLNAIPTDIRVTTIQKPLR